MTLNSHQTVEESIRFGQLSDANYKILRGGGSQMLAPDKLRFAKLAQMGDPDIDEECLILGTKIDKDYYKRSASYALSR